MSAAVRILGQTVSPRTTALFVCDMQERFRPAIQHFDDIVNVTQRLCSAAKILDIPIVVTEQYPKGLGSTVSELQEHVQSGTTHPKTVFSMIIPAVEQRMTTLCDGNLRSVILCGIEAHVCIQQTALDLLSKGLEVHVVADACSSRSQMDRTFAYDRLRQAGCVVSTSESVLLQLVGDKDHPQFKAVQALIKTSAPTSGLVPLQKL